MFAGGRVARRSRCTARDAPAPGGRVDGPGDHRRGQRDDRGRARLAGAVTTRRDLLLTGRTPRAAPRPRPAPTPTRCCWRSSTTCSCRSPSRWACALQNTAHSVNIKERLDFSCALFDARRQPDRQRAAHAGAPGLDGRVDQDRDRRNRGTHAAGRRLRAQRPLPRRHAPARRHRRHAGLRPSRPGAPADICSTSPRAATTPTSAASRPARCRRQQHRIEEEGVLIDNWLLVEQRPAARSRDRSTCWPRGQYPARNPADQPRRPARPDRRQREGRRRSCAAWSSTSASTSCTPTCATCRTTPRRRCAASSTR